MNNNNYVKTVPQEFNCTFNQSNYKQAQQVLRDSYGRICSICYYNLKNELTKQVFYNGTSIKTIEHYYKNNLTLKEEFEDSKLINKKNYYNGEIAYTINFLYNALHYIQKITKNEGREMTAIEYKYDTLNRIISRQIYNNNGLVSKQEYNYDVLNRIIYYSDENQQITVSNYSQKNELLNYAITDKIGNVIYVINHFSNSGYIYTECSSKGNTLRLNDTSYVDNIMLKKPSATEEDLDLIISKLYYQNDTLNDFYEKSTSAGNNASKLIDNTISQRALPISIRKRVLLSIASNSKY